MSKQKKGFVLCMVAAAVMLVVSLLLQIGRASCRERV